MSWSVAWLVLLDQGVDLDARIQYRPLRFGRRTPDAPAVWSCPLRGGTRPLGRRARHGGAWPRSHLVPAEADARTELPQRCSAQSNEW